MSNYRMTKVILAILPSNSIETAVNNLDEADFDLHTVSVIMKDETQARKIIDDDGPLKGMTAETIASKLKTMGISDSDILEYQKELQKNEALIGMTVPDTLVDSAKEMLNDYHPLHMIEI